MEDVRDVGYGNLTYTNARRRHRSWPQQTSEREREKRGKGRGATKAKAKATPPPRPGPEEPTISPAQRRAAATNNANAAGRA